jgi:hypothetical protein
MYTLDKKFKIYYSDFKTIPISNGCKESEILH